MTKKVHKKILNIRLKMSLKMTQECPLEIQCSRKFAFEISMKNFWGTNLVASLVSKSNQFKKKYDNFHKLTLPYL